MDDVAKTLTITGLTTDEAVAEGIITSAQAAAHRAGSAASIARLVDNVEAPVLSRYRIRVHGNKVSFGKRRPR